MSSPSLDWAWAHCLWRYRSFNQMEKATSSATDARLGFAYGLALVLSDNVTKGIKVLEGLADQAPLASDIAIHYAHTQCEVVDHQAVTSLEGSIREKRRKTENKDLYFSGLVYYLTGNMNKASQYVERLLALEAGSPDGLTLSGWIKLNADKKDKTAALDFSRAVDQDKENIDAIFGEAISLCSLEFISKLNQVIVRHPKYVAALVVKMEILLANEEWDQTMAAVSRILTLSPFNIFGLQIKALKLILDGKYDEGSKELTRIREELPLQERKAWWLFTEIASACSKCCAQNEKVLSQTLALAQSAVAVAPNILEPLLELGYQYYLSGSYTDAYSTYSKASSISQSALDALAGLTMVQLAQNGLNSQSKQHIEFLVEVGRTESSLACEIALMEIQLGLGEPVKILDEAVSTKKNKAALHRFGMKYISSLNPDLMVKLAGKYPENDGAERKRISLLKFILKIVPGIVGASLRLSSSFLEIGETDEALKCLENIINNREPTNHEAHLLIAALYINKGDFESGKTCLERGLSSNLKILEHPKYLYLNGIVQKSQGDLKGAKTNFNSALKLHNEGANHLSVPELGRLYKNLSEILMELGDLAEAEALLSSPHDELRGTDCENDVTLAQARLAYLFSNSARCLSLLGAIPQDHPRFVDAQILKAEVCLDLLKDSQAYTECFAQLVKLNPSTENFLLLGDAYLKVQEPELAIYNYDKAVSGASDDPKLLCKLAGVLVRSHQYAKAIKCYRDAGEEGSMALAELLLKLGQTSKAEGALGNVKSSPDKTLLLARVYEKAGDVDKALKTLQNYKTDQWKDNELGAKFYQQMGQYATLLRDYDLAIDSYKNSLSLNSGSHSVHIIQAKLYLQKNDWASCESVCSSLLARDPGNEDALLMLADLAFRRVDFDTAYTHFSALLKKLPSYWAALARIIEVLRRTGNLSEAEEFIEAAKRLEPNHPGLAYCTGLLHWYKGDNSIAVTYFNNARGDPEWGQQAVHNMIEACMSQSGTAKKLLEELQPRTPDEEAELRLLTSFVLLASEDKSQIEKSIIDFTHLANNDLHKVAATLGLAMAYVQQKQQGKARNVLKRVAKSSWKFEDAEYLERSWLLLAELYIQAGKPDTSVELLQKVTYHNQSSGKAYELLGIIAEKDQKYLLASQHYVRAWKLSGESDPNLGFRIAHNFLKGKKYADSISLCQSVLKLRPDYPRIRKDVLEKALANLRT